MSQRRSPANAQSGASDAVLIGILALLTDERESRIGGKKGAEKTEVLLARAGVPVEDIAAATGKSADAIRKAVSRAK